MPISSPPTRDPHSPAPDPLPNSTPKVKLSLKSFAPKKKKRREEVVEADAASDVATKGDGNEEWRSVMRMILQV
jgi:hypothetical protein